MAAELCEQINYLTVKFFSWKNGRLKEFDTHCAVEIYLKSNILPCIIYLLDYYYYYYNRVLSILLTN